MICCLVDLETTYRKVSVAVTFWSARMVTIIFAVGAGEISCSGGSVLFF